MTEIPALFAPSMQSVRLRITLMPSLGLVERCTDSIVARPKLLLFLDEPTSGLDSQSVRTHV
jgi:hypothetical protein